MEHKTFVETERVAEIHPGAPGLSSCERLLLWSSVLERYQGTALLPLRGIEFQSVIARSELRLGGSPLTVAFQDPLLHSDGLCGDALADAVASFQLTDGQAHNVLSECHYETQISANEIVSRLKLIVRADL